MRSSYDELVHDCTNVSWRESMFILQHQIAFDSQIILFVHSITLEQPIRLYCSRLVLQRHMIRLLYGSMTRSCFSCSSCSIAVDSICYWMLVSPTPPAHDSLHAIMFCGFVSYSTHTIDIWSHSIIFVYVSLCMFQFVLLYDTKWCHKRM